MNLQLISFLADLIEKIFIGTPLNDSYLGQTILVREFQRRMELIGFTKLGNGIHRTVFTHYLTPEVVYKFGGWRQNGMEYTTWNHLSDVKRNQFATLYYTNGLVNVMERVEQTIKQANLEHEHENYLSQINDHQLELEDLHASNLGIRANGEIIVIDYGEYIQVPKTNTDLSIPDFPSWERQIRAKLGIQRMEKIIRFNNTYDVHVGTYFDIIPQAQFDTYFIPLILEQREEQLLFELKEETSIKPKEVNSIDSISADIFAPKQFAGWDEVPGIVINPIYQVQEIKEKKKRFSLHPNDKARRKNRGILKHKFAHL